VEHFETLENVSDELVLTLLQRSFAGRIAEAERDSVSKSIFENTRSLWPAEFERAPLSNILKLPDPTPTHPPNELSETLPEDSRWYDWKAKWTGATNFLKRLLNPILRKQKAPEKAKSNEMQERLTTYFPPLQKLTELTADGAKVRLELTGEIVIRSWWTLDVRAPTDNRMWLMSKLTVQFAPNSKPPFTFNRPSFIFETHALQQILGELPSVSEITAPGADSVFVPTSQCA